MANNGTILGPFWDYFGTIWDYFGTILEPFWEHYGIIMGTILRPFLDPSYFDLWGPILTYEDLF